MCPIGASNAATDAPPDGAFYGSIRLVMLMLSSLNPGNYKSSSDACARNAMHISADIVDAITTPSNTPFGSTRTQNSIDPHTIHSR